MITIRELASKTMTPEKRKNAKNDYFAFYVGRPLSYALTIPFLALGCKPNTVSFLSLFPPIIGFFLLGFSSELMIQLCGWFLFLLWNIMDGVDGNIARFTEQTSKLGVLWDAASGYVAMTLTFLAMGMAAFTDARSYEVIPSYGYILLGSFSAIFCLLSRLVMHKKMVLFSVESVDGLNRKEEYGLFRIFALNVTSVSGFMQILMLLAIIFHLADVFTFVYFMIHLLICVISFVKLLHL